MIDYIKMLVSNIDTDRLFQLSILDFKSEISKNTGEVNENNFIAKYYHCEINIKIIKPENEPQRTHVIFTGSIHKMWNELNEIKAPNYDENKPYKGFNGNLFTINDIIETRVHLEKLFNCNSSQMILQNIEFGVNTILNFNPTLFLKGLLYHKNILFDFSHSRNNAQALHQWFIFKIYNKSFQYKMTENVLRVELKIIKMEEIKGFGIKTFADINQNTLLKAQELLLSRFDEVMHFDYTIEKSILLKREKQLIERYSNPRYWIEELKPNHRDRHKKKLNELTFKHSKHIHQQIKNEIIEKCVTINQLSTNTKCVITNTSSIRVNITQNSIKNDKVKTSICKVTGLNLCDEKDGTKYALTTTLKKLKETDPKTFELIKLNLLNRSGAKPKFEQDEIKHLAKQIRNKYYNPFKIKQKGYNQPVYYFQHSQLNILNQLGI